MRNWILLVAVAISFALVAQKGGKKGNTQGGKPGKNQVFKQPKNTGKSKGNKPIKFQPKKNKGNVQGQKNLKPQGGKHKMQGKGKSGPIKPHQKYQSKFKYKKGHPNHVYMFSYSPFHYPTKNYGQWRSQQARNKHKAYRPVLQIDVLDAIVMIRERNVFLLGEVDYKINRYNTLVIERHDRGLITDAQFSIHMGNVKRMKKRRGRYHY